jgi:crotonobetainyl-CoA hydratase
MNILIASPSLKTEGTMTADDALVLERPEGHVRVITLNRPAALNSVHADLAVALSQAVDRFQADPDARVAVITGTGRAFCAGADLKAIARGEDTLLPGHPELGFAGLTQRTLTKPLVAAVNGLALGGGAELVLACDLAVMSEDAELGLPEVTRGIFPGGGGAIRLPQHAPLKLAMEKLLTGDRISAAEALAWGLVNAVTPADDVVSTAVDLAGRIARNSPQSVRVTRDLALAAAGAGSPWADVVWARNAELNETIPLTEDALEGARAFVERRLPAWQLP